MNEADDLEYDEENGQIWTSPAPTTPEQPEEPKDEHKGASHLMYTSALAFAALAATVM